MSYVTKRDGRKEAFQAEKIKMCVDWACKGLHVNPLELESKFDQFIYDDISTIKIQENLIHHARSLASYNESDWVFVAGRLQTMIHWSDNKSYLLPFVDYFNEQRELGFYSHPGLDIYTEHQLEIIGNYIDSDRDLDHSYGSVLTSKHKYLLPAECIQHMHLVNAMIIASVEEKASERLAKVKEIYEALSLRKLSLASPWLSNLRNNGNISSCFIMALDDNIHSIFDNIKRAALISKNGGGLGVDFSRIRSKGATVNGLDNASGGVVGWIKLFNDTALYVNQGGKRAGAFTTHLPLWHRDIEDFLEIQTEQGDQRKKSYDVFPQVGVHDLFMEQQESEGGGYWYTFCPYEIKQVLDISLFDVFGKDFKREYKKCIHAFEKGKLKNVGVYNAKELLKQIMKIQFDTGLPYIAFLDTMNETNPNKHDGIISCANLCTESYSNICPDELIHCCNLASIVVGRVDSDEEMIYLAELATYILDNGIELTKTPIDIAGAHNSRYRTIGVGIQGLHDYLVKNNTNYNDLAAIRKLSELIEYGCVKKSIELSSTRGRYPVFKDSEWCNGNMINKFKKYSISGLDWSALQEGINKYGIRNSQLTSPAPNTTTSIFMDACAGISPVYSGFYDEDNKSGKFPVAAMYLKENPLGYAKSFQKFDQVHLTKVTGELQKFVDTGVSSEFIFDRNIEGFSAKWLYDTIVSAWKEKNKCIYYIRSIKPGESWQGKEAESCEGCAG